MTPQQSTRPRRIAVHPTLWVVVAAIASVGAAGLSLSLSLTVLALGYGAAFGIGWATGFWRRSPWGLRNSFAVALSTTVLWLAPLFAVETRPCENMAPMLEVHAGFPFSAIDRVTEGNFEQRSWLPPEYRGWLVELTGTEWLWTLLNFAILCTTSLLVARILPRQLLLWLQPLFAIASVVALWLFGCWLWEIW